MSMCIKGLPLFDCFGIFFQELFWSQRVRFFLPKIPFLEGEKMTSKLIKPEHQTYPIVAKAKIGPSPNKLFIFL